MRELLQGWVSSIFGTGMFESAEGILGVNPSDGRYQTIWKVISGLYDNVCVPIAVGLVLIYFMIHLIERSMQQQQLDLEQIVKSLMKLILGLYFIQHGLELMAEIYGLGMAFLNDIVSSNSVGSSTPGDAIAREAWKELTGENWDGDWGIWDAFSKGMPLFLQLFLPWLGSQIIKLIAIGVCFFRWIEFYILTCTAPFALSDFFTEGLHGNGWRFVKNYIALALQGGIIMLAIVIFNGIIVTFLPSGSLVDMAVPIVGMGKAAYFLLMYLAGGAACGAVMLKSRSLAKEIIGVQ